MLSNTPNTLRSDPMLDAAKACITCLDLIPARRWSETFVDLYLVFFRQFGRGLVISISHGVNFFHNVVAEIEGTSKWDEKGEYGENFRKMIAGRAVQDEPESLPQDYEIFHDLRPPKGRPVRRTCLDTLIQVARGMKEGDAVALSQSEAQMFRVILAAMGYRCVTDADHCEVPRKTLVFKLPIVKA